MTERSRQAEDLFRQGYSCAQSVLIPFCAETGLSPRTAALLASSFGGGMGRLREVCGAFSAMLMVVGLTHGSAAPADEDGKARQYAEIQRLAALFRQQNGSIICRDLLEGVPVTAGSTPQPRTSDYYRQRPCQAIVGRAAALTEFYLMEKDHENCSNL